MMNTTNIPPYMQPDSWVQFWQAQNKSNQPADVMKTVRDFSRLQNQYMQRMLTEWQQLTEATTRPETMPQEYNKFMQRTAENTMEHAQNVVHLMQEAGVQAAKTCKASKKEA